MKQNKKNINSTNYSDYLYNGDNSYNYNFVEELSEEEKKVVKKLLIKILARL
tara:strand:- start:852 stop:1007 length:156 start_codon:yes stop_codon:yes gene_type:complete